MKNLNFEYIGRNLERAETPEGWLVREYNSNSRLSAEDMKNRKINVSLTFIPDPEHLWLGDIVDNFVLEQLYKSISHGEVIYKGLSTYRGQVTHMFQSVEYGMQYWLPEELYYHFH